MQSSLLAKIEVLPNDEICKKFYHNVLRHKTKILQEHRNVVNQNQPMEAQCSVTNIRNQSFTAETLKQPGHALV